jgi:hypothetical protein
LSDEGGGKLELEVLAETATAELQRLKPQCKCLDYVASEAATHKDSADAT